MPLRLGVVLRNMGPQSTPALIAAAARAADATPAIADVWVTDHLAIPPDQAEGSGGRYLDPLATLAYLAAVTRRVGLGTAVLVLPYRTPLPTAKWVASVQELSAGRLQLGVGVGWMEPEFRALGVDPRRRGALADATLDLLDACFAADTVTAHGQPFLFLPRPPRPPLFIGGAPPHALRRAIRHRAGWLPVGLPPDLLRAPVTELRTAAATAGLPSPEVAVMTTLPLDDPGATRERLAAYVDAGATRIIHGARYTDLAEFEDMLDRLARAATAP